MDLSWPYFRYPAPTPDQTYTMLVPTFAKKGNFSKLGAKSRKRDKSAKFWNSVNILHASACYHSGFHTLDLGRVFKYSFQIRRIEKYDVHGKKYYTQLISLSQKEYFILFNGNIIAFCFKKGCLIGPQNHRFRLKERCFSRPESAKRGVFQV